MPAPAFVTNLARFEDRIALVDDVGRSLSYAELAQEVCQLIATLEGPRRLLMVEAANTLSATLAYLAALGSGHPVIVAKPGEVSEKGQIYQTFKPATVHLIGEDGFQDVAPDEWAGAADLEVDFDPALTVLYSTSGSTGSAKLVRLSAENIESNADSIATYLGIDEHEIAPLVVPLSYPFAPSILNSHLIRGARVVLTEHSVVDPEFKELFAREKCTSLSGVPYTWELIERVGLLNHDWPHLKTLTQAGGRMPPDRVMRLATWAREHGSRLFVMYGQTECTARMAYLPWEHTFDHSDCIGVAIPGGEFRLIDEEGVTLEGGNVRGELVYSGPNVMMGYATERADLALPAGPNERFTGDLAERNELGLYRIVGRLSRFSKIMGLRISLDEVEAMVKQHGVDDAQVSGDDDVIAICFRRGAADRRALEADVARRCGIPASIVVAVEVEGEIPRLHNGKVDYLTIRALAKDIASDRKSQSQGRLRDEIAGLLGRDTLEDGQSFSSLGGDSLTYIQASFAIERHLGHLPASWEMLPIEVLEAAEAREGLSSAVDTDVLLRALAITVVVYNHTRPGGTWPLPGGAATLLLLAGMNLARFRSAALFRGEGWPLVQSSFTRYMLPYLGILVFYLIAKGKLDLPSLFLVSTFVSDRAGTFLEPFWFIEVFFHLMIVMAGLFAVRPLREAIEKHPFEWGIAAVAALGGLHIASNEFGFPLPPLLVFSGIFGLGWAIHFARTTAARVLLSVGTLGLPWLVPRGETVAAVLLILVWLPRVPVFFAWVKHLAGRVGAASFHIYILHAVVITVIGNGLDVRGSWLFPLLGVPLSLLAGVAFNAFSVQKLLSFWRNGLRADQTLGGAERAPD